MKTNITKLKTILNYPQINRLRKLAIDYKCKLYLTGGSLRDLILNKKITDFDLIVSGDIFKFTKKFAHQIKASHILLDKRRKTVRLAAGNKHIFDFTPLERKPNHLRPNVKVSFKNYEICRKINGISFLTGFTPLETNLIRELTRRDFTVNSLAFDLVNLVFLDPLSGLLDLKNKIIRMNSDKVFKSDPVRLLRAVRLKSDLGFEIEDKTLQQMKKDKKIILKTKPERITEEFFKILSSANSITNVKLLDEIGLNGIIFAAKDKKLKKTLIAYKNLENYFNRGIKDERIYLHYNNILASSRKRIALIKLISLVLDKKMKNPARVFKVFKLSLKEKRILENILRFYHIFHRKFYQYSFLKQTEPAFLDLIILNLAQKNRKNLALKGEVSSQRGKIYSNVAFHPRPKGRGIQGDFLINKVKADKLFSMYFDYKERKVQFKNIINGNILKSRLKLKPGPVIGFLLDKLQEAYCCRNINTQKEALKLARKLLDTES